MKCRKKPTSSNAIQWTGHNLNEVYNLTNGQSKRVGEDIIISSIRGDQKALLNDWIVRDGYLGFLTMGDYVFSQAYETSE